jgi:hypothetical protein
VTRTQLAIAANAPSPQALASVVEQLPRVAAELDAAVSALPTIGVLP